MTALSETPWLDLRKWEGRRKKGRGKTHKGGWERMRRKGEGR